MLLKPKREAYPLDNKRIIIRVDKRDKTAVECQRMREGKEDKEQRLREENGHDKSIENKIPRFYNSPQFILRAKTVALIL